MYTLKKFSIGLLIFGSLSAAAEFETVTRAYEIALDEFRVPATANSALSFKQCSSCDVETIRVTNRTQYIVNAERIELLEFKKAISRVRNREDKGIIVKHHLESDTIVSVSISLPR
jgi:hypothetical protein